MTEAIEIDGSHGNGGGRMRVLIGWRTSLVA
jgi:hypothetical protein